MRISHALRAARHAVFPNNGLGPPRVVPDDAEALEIKRRAAAAVLSAVPDWAWGLYLGRRGGDGNKQRDPELWETEVEGWLDVVGDPYMNRHLVVRIVELVVVRLVPEMGERGVDTLLSERVGGL